MTTSSLETRVLQLQEKTFASMRETRGSKYDGIISGMQKSFWLFLIKNQDYTKAKLKSQLLLTYYTYMRNIDDVVDGDMPLPNLAKTKSDYINARLAYAQNINDQPSDPADELLLYCQGITNKLGYNFSKATIDILSSMQFDAPRAGTFSIPTAAELQEHFHLQDIRGTISGMLMLFDEDPNRYSELELIGNAHRLSLTIKDMAEDIKNGIINIPAEDCTAYGITAEDLKLLAANNWRPNRPTYKRPKSLQYSLASAAVEQWMSAQSARGLEMISEHHQKRTDFSIFGKFVLRFVYENPAKKVFLNAL